MVLAAYRAPALLAAAILFIVSGPTRAQWLNYKTPSVPRAADGKPNLTAPAPRALDGKPDLSGVWLHEKTTLEEMKRLYGNLAEEAGAVDVPGMELDSIHKYTSNILIDHKPEEGIERPGTLEQMRQHPLDQRLGCAGGASFVPSFPVAGLVSEPIKIVQSPRLTIVLYEAGNLFRQIHTDGRELPKEFDLPAFHGYSAGHWEGDTLVVETAGFNNKTILDVAAHPHSDALHVTERFHRSDFGHLDYEVTFDDPKMYTKPFTVKIPHELLADSDIFEMYSENEKDCAHIGKQ
jgi:hypothetical protein